MKVEAVIVRRGDWWHFTLPTMPSEAVRPGRKPVTLGGQAKSWVGAIDGAAKIVSLATGIPEDEITINPIPDPRQAPHKTISKT